MKKIASVTMAIIITILVCGCSWEDIAYGLTQLSRGTYVLDNSSDGGCNEWYDFLDPGCY